MKPLPVTILLAATIFTATPSFAEGQEGRSIAIDLAGVDLASDAGAAHALRRIERAAIRACEAREGRQNLEERQLARACVEEATERAVQELDAPLVTARFTGDARLAQGVQRRSR